jgi:hypothetical protein
MCYLSDYQDIKFEDCQCIATFILERAFSKFEFEEVRKLSAELCGRLHPQVLIDYLPCSCIVGQSCLNVYICFKPLFQSKFYIPRNNGRFSLISFLSSSLLSSCESKAHAKFSPVITRFC